MYVSCPFLYRKFLTNSQYSTKHHMLTFWSTKSDLHSPSTNFLLLWTGNLILTSKIPRIFNFSWICQQLEARKREDSKWPISGNPVSHSFLMIITSVRSRASIQKPKQSLDKTAALLKFNRTFHMTVSNKLKT